MFKDLYKIELALEALGIYDALDRLRSRPVTTIRGGGVAEGVTDHTLLTNIGTNAHIEIDTHIGDDGIHFTESSIDHVNILNIGTNTHAQLDSHVADSTIHFTEASIDHTAIQNIGTNTHVQIDSHIADSTIHFTEGSIDHGSIAGLADDDHTQYIIESPSDNDRNTISVPTATITGLTVKTTDDNTTRYLTEYQNSSGVRTMGVTAGGGIDSGANVTGINIDLAGADKTMFRAISSSTVTTEIFKFQVQSNSAVARIQHVLSGGDEWLRLSIADSVGTDIIRLDGRPAGTTLFQQTVRINELDINNEYIFPTSDGTANQIFTTNGAGVITFADPNSLIDHGSIAGLGDDDHTQYHNDTRGDARYVNLTGDTMTGPLTIAGSTDTDQLIVKAASGQNNSTHNEILSLRNSSNSQNVGWSADGHVGYGIAPQDDSIIRVQATTDVNTNSTFYGAQYSITSNSGTVGNLAAFRSTIIMQNSIRTSNAAGFRIEAKIQGSAVSTQDLVGGYIQVEAKVPSRHIKGLSFEAWGVSNASGSLTTLKGISIDTPASLGTITTLHGIKVENMNVGTTSYAIETGLGRIKFGGSLQLPIETITASSDTLDTTNHTVLCNCTSNAITVNLPAASGNTGLIYSIKKTDSTGNAVTIDGSGSETIDGATTKVISTQWDSVTIQCNGTSWFIIK